MRRFFAGADLRCKPLAMRREMLRDLISKLPDTIRFSETFDASASELILVGKIT
jgi:hypothetical protein